MMNIKSKSTFYIGTILLIGACAMVPITERSQLRLLPESQLVQMSFNSYDEVLSQSQIVRGTPEAEMINRVGERLSRATEAYLTQNGQSVDHFSWQYTLIKEDDTINAWAMPGGKIAFYTGILPIAQDEAGIAVIMGHEIAHVVASHGNERMSHSMLVQMGGAALSYALQEKPEQTRQLYNQAYGVGSQVGVLLPYSRLQESEADRIGLTLMAMAGYDPRAAVPLWQRMDQASSGQQPPQFLSTHPAPSQRIVDIESFLPEAMAIYEQNASI